MDNNKQVIQLPATKELLHMSVAELTLLRMKLEDDIAYLIRDKQR